MRHLLCCASSLLAITAASAAPAYAQDAPTSPTATAPASAVHGDGVIAGVVTQNATGRALSGALVTVRETGETVRTDSDGSFRIVGLPAGDYTLAVSFIGLAAGEATVSVAAAGESQVAIALDASEDIVVTGTRSALALALNEQRSLDNSATVASSDLTGRFPDNTAAEALRRLPGVSFQRQEGSGEGQFISIRGLDAGLNNVQINGVNSAIANAGGEGDAGDRRVPIDAFQSDSISKIVVNKSLLPNHEGVGLGGAVELSTKTPFELRKDLISVSAEAERNDFRDKTGYRVGGTISHLFGADDSFGILLSAAYRKRYNTSFQFQADTQPRPRILPALERANGPLYVPGQSTGAPFFPTSEAQLPSDYDFDLDDAAGNSLRTLRTQNFDIDRENLSLTGALDWQPAEHTVLSLIGSFNETKFERTESRTEYRQSTRYIERVGNVAAGARLTPFDANNDGVADGGLRNFAPSNPEIRTRGAFQNYRSENNSVVLKGKTELDRWTLNYQAGYAEASNFTDSTEIEFRRARVDNANPAVLNPVGALGVRFFDINSVDNPRAPYIANLTDVGRASLTDPTTFPFNEFDTEFTDTKDERWSARLDATYATPISWLEAVTIGAKYETSDRRQDFVNITDSGRYDADGSFRPSGNGTFTLADTDLLTGTLIDFGQIGVPQYDGYQILRFDRDAIRDFRDRVLETLPIAAGERVASDALGGNEEQVRIKEDIWAAYAMGKIVEGDFSAIAGVRIEHGKVRALVDQTVELDFTSQPDVIESIAGQETRSSYTEFLPRAQFNFRPSNNLVFRAAYYSAIARPEYSALAAAQSIELDQADGSINIELGNPNLENAYAHNFDVGVEWYQGSIGFVGVNLFYKRINRFLFENEGGRFQGGVEELQAQIDALTGRDLDLAALGITSIDVGQPQNGRTAEVYGVELSLIRQFNELPGFLSGFGVYANVTVQETKATLELERDALTGETLLFQVPFFNAPDYVGTAALTYTKYGIDATLSYSRQGKVATAVVSVGDYARYDRAYDSLDLTFNYTLPWRTLGETTLFFAATDILDDGDKPINHESYGASGLFLNDVEYDGRTVRFGVRSKF